MNKLYMESDTFSKFRVGFKDIENLLRYNPLDLHWYMSSNFRFGEYVLRGYHEPTNLECQIVVTYPELYRHRGFDTTLHFISSKVSEIERHILMRIQDGRLNATKHS